MDNATAADGPLMISAVTVVELVYLVEKGTFSPADLEAFYEILDATDSGFEVVSIDTGGSAEFFPTFGGL
jgi:predicted nucleic-acid-binding protein